jgi:hypothetical protein
MHMQCPDGNWYEIKQAPRHPDAVIPQSKRLPLMRMICDLVVVL